MNITGIEIPSQSHMYFTVDKVEVRPGQKIMVGMDKPMQDFAGQYIVNGVDGRIVKVIKQRAKVMPLRPCSGYMTII